MTVRQMRGALARGIKKYCFGYKQISIVLAGGCANLVATNTPLSGMERITIETVYTDEYKRQYENIFGPTAYGRVPFSGPCNSWKTGKIKNEC